MSVCLSTKLNCSRILDISQRIQSLVHQKESVPWKIQPKVPDWVMIEMWANMKTLGNFPLLGMKHNTQYIHCWEARNPGQTKIKFLMFDMQSENPQGINQPLTQTFLPGGWSMLCWKTVPSHLKTKISFLPGGWTLSCYAGPPPGGALPLWLLPASEEDQVPQACCS